MKRGRVLSLTLVLVTLVLGSIFLLVNDNSKNITGNVVANPVVLSSSTDYQVKELVTLSAYPWYMDSLNGKVYVGTYGGSNNYYYVSQSPFTNWDPVLITSTGEESLRVYNLNNRIYITGEDGFISADLQACTNLHDRYVLGAEYFGGHYLVSVAESDKEASAKTEIWTCPCAGGATCSRWGKTLSDIRAFDMKEYQGYLYAIGTKNYRSGSGRVYKIDSAGNYQSTGWNYGEGVMAEKFDGKLFLGYSGYTGSKIASVYSFDGTNIRLELSTPGMKHFGDFKEFDGKLFITVAQEPGGAEIWYREKNSNGGAWKKLTSLSSSKYGAGQRALINPTGMMAVADNRLFISVNSPNTVRGGPGYLLEISKSCQTQEICGNNVDENCNEIINDGCVQANGNCSLTWGGKNFVAQNNTGAISYYNSLDWFSDHRFMCLDSRVYECGWELNRPEFAVKDVNNQIRGDWRCNLGSTIWATTIPENNTVPNPSNNGNRVALTYTYVNNSAGVNNYIAPQDSNNINYSDSDFDSVEDSVDQCPGTQIQFTVNSLGCPRLSQTQFNLSADLSESNLRDLAGLEIFSANGKIRFKQNISLLTGNNPTNLNTAIIIDNDLILVDSETNPGLNVSAELEFYNISFNSPVILRNGEVCEDCSILNYDRETKILRVSVNHFTTYLVVNASDLIFNDSTQLEDEASYSSNTENITSPPTDDVLSPGDESLSAAVPSSKPLWPYFLLAGIFLVILAIAAWIYLKNKLPKPSADTSQEPQQPLRPQMPSQGQRYTPFRSVQRRV